MKRDRDFKPCDALTLQDFKRHTIWAFDLERGENHPEADETWVSPLVFEKAPETSYGLFIRSEFRLGDGSVRSGALGAEFINGRLSVDFLVFLTPKYFALSTATPSRRDKRHLISMDPQVKKWFPITYNAVLPHGRSRSLLAGTMS